MYEINRNEHLEQNASKITEMVSSTLPQESTSEEVTIGYNGVFEVLIMAQHHWLDSVFCTKNLDCTWTEVVV